MNFADPRALCALESFTDVDILENMTNGLLPMVHVLPYVSPCMAFLYFDLEQMFAGDENARELQLMFKGIESGIDPLMTNDCCGFNWYEQKKGIFRAKVDATNVAASTTLVVADADQLQGVGVGSMIHVSVGSSVVGGPTVTFVARINTISIALNVATIVLDRATPAGILPWDLVFRGAHTKIACAAVDNKYDLDKVNRYEAYFQDFHASLEFNLCDLNKQRRVADMRGMKSSIYLVNAKVRNTFDKLIANDISYGLLLGANHRETGVYGSEMQGILTAIQDAQEDCSLPIITALDCCGVNDTTQEDDDDTVYNMVMFFMDRLESGYYGSDEPITVLINSEGYKQIQFLRDAIQRFFNNGVNVLVTQNAESYDGCRDYKNLRVMSFAFEGGQYVDFVQFLPFDAWYPTEPLMIAMPKSMISMYQKMVSGLDANLNPILSTPWSFPTLKFKKNETLQAQNWRDECFQYLTGVELGQILVGVRSGAWAAMKGFRRCNLPACTGTSANIVTFIDRGDCPTANIS